MGVTSLIELISNPADCNARMAVSRPAPGPFTKTFTSRIPISMAFLAAASAATEAAKGVPFFVPLKPTAPADDQATDPPPQSLIEMMVLLKVALICATPSAGTFLSFLFLGLVFTSVMVIQLFPPFLFLFLSGAHRLSLTTLSPCIGAGSLTARRQTLAMPGTTVGTDINQAFNIHRNFSS